MKLFFISDIHGSKYYLKKAMDMYKQEKADYIIILGDILYHGARNPLPRGYDPRGVIEILNNLSDKIIAVRGNCDSEVDEMVVDFPIMSTYSNLIVDGRRLFLTHGHIYNDLNMVDLEEGSAFVYGHSHIPRADYRDGIYFLNPGSISLPKEDNPATYAVLEDGIFEIKDLNGEKIKKIELK